MCLRAHPGSPAILYLFQVKVSIESLWEIKGFVLLLRMLSARNVQKCKFYFKGLTIQAGIHWNKFYFFIFIKKMWFSCLKGLSECCLLLQAYPGSSANSSGAVHYFAKPWRYREVKNPFKDKDCTFVFLIACECCTLVFTMIIPFINFAQYSSFTQLQCTYCSASRISL